jgi:hypothetical protein
MRFAGMVVVLGCFSSCVLTTGQAPDRLVEKAFTLARGGDFTGIRELAKLGPNAAPEVAAYLNDRSPELRVEALGLLTTYRACSDLSAALTNSEAEVRDRAASALFEACGVRVVDAGVASALRKSIEMGNTSSVALLLLGKAGDSESIAVLRKQAAAEGMVKFAMDSQPIPQSLAAKLGLFESGVSGPRAELESILTNPDPAQARFFLDALPFIDDAQLLKLASRRLEDTRPIPNERRRRICDYALTAFAGKFHLQLSFKVRDYGQYDADSLAEARRAVESAIGSL